MLPFSQWQVLTHPRPGALLAPPTGRGGPPSPELQALNAERLEEDRLAVEGLATTSLLSVAVGALGALRAKGARSRAFHVTSTAVHLFVLGTAVVGCVAIEAQDPKRLGTEDSVQRGFRLLRLLKAGMASDVGAMAAGALSLLGARWRRHDGLAGAGTSLLLHGALLLLFDTGLFLRNAWQQRRVLESTGLS
ncbi:MAG TPA: hypothetical protein VE153_39660 [Myxococcus sp.]|nr:hypothetical protein [Myxococcus sp.]